tara:strand:- start:350 stop:928 length:579 start_codon:yes stop_codon:yes gene_type:complete
MKIHGTAKGGAISKKDFGVAFGGAPCVDEAWMSTLDFDPDSTLTLTAAYPSRGEGTVGVDSSAMIDEIITTVKCNLADAEAGSALDGTIYCEVRRLSDNNLQHSLDDMPASELDGTKTQYTFSGSNYTIKDGETICIRYDNASSTKQITLYRSADESAYDGTNSGRSVLYSSSGEWAVEASEDWLAIFSSCT